VKPAAEITNYDKIAQFYIEHVENERSWNNLYERPYMLSVLDELKGRDVLDVGCGSGFYSFHALKQGARVTAIDVSQLMLDHIKQKAPRGEINLIRADIADGLPFLKDDTQDYIICSLVLHYIENWEKLVNDCWRVLRKKGKLYISTHHPFNDFVYLKKKSYFDKYLAEDSWGTGSNKFPVHYFTRPLKEVIQPFLDSKFKLLKLDEPLPDLTCKDKDPSAYEFFQSNPAFIFLILVK